MEESQKKKTIQFENKEGQKDPDSKENRASISPPTQGGILKKKRVSINAEPIQIPEHNESQEEEKKPGKEENSGKIPLLNLNFEEEPKPKKNWGGHKLEKPKSKELFTLKKNHEIKELPENISEKFEKLNDGLEKLRKDCIKKEEDNDSEEKKINKLRISQDADYIEENIYKALREGVDEMFLKKYFLFY